MRIVPLIGLIILGVAIAFTPTSTRGQFPGGGGGGRPQWGGGQGGGRFGGGMMMQDPNTLFEFYAKGRPYFLISETRMLREPLTQFAQQKNITSGQITRQQFVEFNEQMRAKSGGRFGGSSKMPLPNGPAGTAGMSMPAVPSQNADGLTQWADSDFKRRDANGDGMLNADEMPGALRDNLAKWDTNKDGLIDQTEYRFYFLARLQGGDQESGGAPKQLNTIATIIIEEEDWDRKPTVLRAGNLPRDGLPKWFKELDTDNDGQVALYEWRKAGKPLDEFQTWDANDDGFITPEEAMKQQSLLAKNSPQSGPASMGSMGFNSERNGGNGGGGRSFSGGKGGNKGGGGWFSRKKSDNGS